VDDDRPPITSLDEFRRAVADDIQDLNARAGADGRTHHRECEFRICRTMGCGGVGPAYSLEESNLRGACCPCTCPEDPRAIDYDPFPQSA
jgi:hypothetical protein